MKSPTLLKPKGSITNYSHERCYANKTKNCSTKISREHFISNNILEGFEENKKVKIGGLPWQKNETFNLLSRESLVSNILCTNHNNLLSPFDSEMGEFYRTIVKYDKDFNIVNPTNDTVNFCGEDLEKWMLKTVCAFVASKQITRNGVKVSCQLKEKFIDILFNDAPFPENWGFYLKVPSNNVIQNYPSISFRPFTENNEVKAAEFLINNFILYLVLGEPNDSNLIGIHRPIGIEFRKGTIKKTIEIYWEDKKYNQGIFLKRIGTTVTPPDEWEDWMKK